MYTKFLVNVPGLILTGFILISSSFSFANSYYESKVCRRFALEDAQIIFPWNEYSNSVFNSNCSFDEHLEQLQILKNDFVSKSFDSLLVESLNKFQKINLSIMQDTFCCISNKDKCSLDKNFCDNNGFSEGEIQRTLDDFNDRLKVVRISAYRMNPSKAKGDFSTKKTIETPKNFVTDKFLALAPEVLSPARMPSYLNPLTQEEVDIAKSVLSSYDESTFNLKEFITKDPETDYFLMIKTAPFLAEIQKNKIDKDDLKEILRMQIQRSKSYEFENNIQIYLNHTKLIEKKLEKYSKSPDLLRKLCRHAEYKRNLAISYNILKKISPIVLGSVVGLGRGIRTNLNSKNSIWSKSKNSIYQSALGATTGTQVSSIVDLYRVSEVDKICQTKYHDPNYKNKQIGISEICNQQSLLTKLDDFQLSLIVNAGAFAGFLLGPKVVELIKKNYSKSTAQ